MNRSIILALSALALASATSAQTFHNAVTPSIGEAATASVGDTVYERDHYSTIPAYAVKESFEGKNVFADVAISPADRFMAIPTKSRLKACRSPSIAMFKAHIYDACLYDDDGDGTFDRFGGNEVQGGKKLPHPMPYTPSEYIEATPDSIKQVVIFLGSTKDTLRLSYREFVNDMARPAFTEEYTFPLATTYPQAIAFKGVKMTVTSIDGEGIHYVVNASPGN